MLGEQDGDDTMERFTKTIQDAKREFTVKASREFLRALKDAAEQAHRAAYKAKLKAKKSLTNG